MRVNASIFLPYAVGNAHKPDMYSQPGSLDDTICDIAENYLDAPCPN